MPQDRYNFDKQFDSDIEVDLSKLNTRWYDDQMLSNEQDAKISARREARKAKYKKEKEKDVKVISPEDVIIEKKREKREINKKTTILLIFVFIGVIVFVGFQGAKLTSLQLEKKAAEKELAALNEKVEQLSDELRELDSDEYIENSARSELHMIRKGEVMYIVDPGTKAEDSDSNGAK